jgi:hypothetical protein
MKIKLVAFSLIALFALSLVTVRLKTREALLAYEIADLETYEELLRERYIFLKTEVEKRTGVVGLLRKAAEHGICLHMSGFEGRHVPLLDSVEESMNLE